MDYAGGKAGGGILGWLPPHLLTQALIVTSPFLRCRTPSNIQQCQNIRLAAQHVLLHRLLMSISSWYTSALCPPNPPPIVIFPLNVRLQIHSTLADLYDSEIGIEICVRIGSPTCSPRGVGSSQIPPGTGSLSWRALCVDKVIIWMMS